MVRGETGTGLFDVLSATAARVRRSSSSSGRLDGCDGSAMAPVAILSHFRKCNVGNSYPPDIDTTVRLGFAWYGCGDRETASRPRDQSDRPEKARRERALANPHGVHDRSGSDRAMGTGRPAALGVGSRLASVPGNHDHGAEEPSDRADSPTSGAGAVSAAPGGRHARMTATAVTGRGTASFAYVGSYT